MMKHLMSLALVAGLTCGVTSARAGDPCNPCPDPCGKKNRLFDRLFKRNCPCDAAPVCKPIAVHHHPAPCDPCADKQRRKFFDKWFTKRCGCEAPVTCHAPKNHCNDACKDPCEKKGLFSGLFKKKDDCDPCHAAKPAPCHAAPAPCHAAKPAPCHAAKPAPCHFAKDNGKWCDPCKDPCEKKGLFSGLFKKKDDCDPCHDAKPAPCPAAKPVPCHVAKADPCDPCKDPCAKKKWSLFGVKDNGKWCDPCGNKH